MRRDTLTDVTGLTLDERTELSLRELSDACQASAEMLMELVDQGLLRPRGRTPQHWRFPALDVKRVHIAVNLQQDLGVNLPGVALAVEMMEELQSLRRRVRLLEQLIDDGR
jgi:chaperone modulatory protein CbpM